ncbi:MAG: redoxin domain-containing protein [Planctomycetaceae bacterium]|nr:redoxin domain-containing protein [Planctomycetaceae bacterium]
MAESSNIPRSHDVSDLQLEADDANASPPGLERAVNNKPLLWLLGGIALLYAAVLIYHVSVPQGSPTNQAFLEQCRQICLKYGLVSTGNVKEDARAFLTAVNARPISVELKTLLSDKDFQPAESQPHVLLGQQAPDFELMGSDGNTYRLADVLKDGPVVLVFYYGYACSHCVAQLYALNDDLGYFHELGAKIVAVSPDTIEQTNKSYEEYGKFDFLVLSDPDDQIAYQFGCHKPADAASDEVRQHGTFLIQSDGRITWAYRGVTPFTDNKSLLFELSTPKNSAESDSTAQVSLAD